MKIQKLNEEQQLTSQKPPQRFSQAKYHRWEFLTFRFIKIDYRSAINIAVSDMFFIWWRFW